jgi:hypothetical protein
MIGDLTQAAARISDRGSVAARDVWRKQLLLMAIAVFAMVAGILVWRWTVVRTPAARVGAEVPAVGSPIAPLHTTLEIQVLDVRAPDPASTASPARDPIVSSRVEVPPGAKERRRPNVEPVTKRRPSGRGKSNPPRSQEPEAPPLESNPYVYK